MFLQNLSPTCALFMGANLPSFDAECSLQREEQAFIIGGLIWHFISISMHISYLPESKGARTPAPRAQIAWTSSDPCEI